MKRIILISLVAIAFPSIDRASDVTKELIVSEGKTRAYHLYLADKTSGSKPLPLIVLLHGSGQNGLLM